MAFQFHSVMLMHMLTIAIIKSVMILLFFSSFFLEKMNFSQAINKRIQQILFYFTEKKTTIDSNVQIEVGNSSISFNRNAYLENSYGL